MVRQNKVRHQFPKLMVGSIPMTEKIRLARVLLTNDDGIDAPGLAVLTAIAGELADEVWIIAPEHDQSGTSLSFGLHHARRVYTRGVRRFSVSGTPADCVVLSQHLLNEARPQLLLCGVNAGANLGDDTNMSGTIGGALAGLMMKIPSIAISQCCDRGRELIRWDTTRQHVPALLQSLLHQGWRKDHCLSINIPDVAPDKISEAVWVRQASRTITSFKVEQRLDLRGQDYYWLTADRRQPETPAADTDLAAIRRGQIAITCLGLDRSKDVSHEPIKLDLVRDSA
jgi:5'-nucleotidase